MTGPEAPALTARAVDRPVALVATMTARDDGSVEAAGDPRAFESALTAALTGKR